MNPIHVALGAYLGSKASVKPTGSVSADQDRADHAAALAVAARLRAAEATIADLMTIARSPAPDLNAAELALEAYSADGDAALALPSLAFSQTSLLLSGFRPRFEDGSASGYYRHVEALNLSNIVPDEASVTHVATADLTRLFDVDVTRTVKNVAMYGVSAPQAVVTFGNALDATLLIRLPTGFGHNVACVITFDEEIAFDPLFFSLAKRGQGPANAATVRAVGPRSILVAASHGFYTEDSDQAVALLTHGRGSTSTPLAERWSVGTPGYLILGHRSGTALTIAGVDFVSNPYFVENDTATYGGQHDGQLTVTEERLLLTRNVSGSPRYVTTAGPSWAYTEV